MTGRGYLRDLVFLGTPHFGAPAERAGAHADFLLGISPYSAPFARLGKVRSAGIKDLRHGNLRDDAGETTSFIAPAAATGRGALLRHRSEPAATPVIRIPHPWRWPGAGERAHWVAIAIASLSLAIPDDHRWVGYGMGHFDLLRRQEVYDRIRSWLDTDRGTLIASKAR